MVHLFHDSENLFNEDKQSLVSQTADAQLRYPNDEKCRENNSKMRYGIRNPCDITSQTVM